MQHQKPGVVKCSEKAEFSRVEPMNLNLSMTMVGCPMAKLRVDRFAYDPNPSEYVECHPADKTQKTTCPVLETGEAIFIWIET